MTLEEAILSRQILAKIAEIDTEIDRLQAARKWLLARHADARTAPLVKGAAA